MILQFHFWVYTQKKWNKSVEEIFEQSSVINNNNVIAHSSIITNSQKVEATQVSIGEWMDKQNGVWTYNGILLSLKKEENSDTCYHMDEPWGH